MHTQVSVHGMIMNTDYRCNVSSYICILKTLLVATYCIAESTVYVYTDRPLLVIPIYMPCSMRPDKVKPVNGHSTTPYFHLETIKTTMKHFLVFEEHKDKSCAIQQDPMCHYRSFISQACPVRLGRVEFSDNESPLK